VKKMLFPNPPDGFFLADPDVAQAFCITEQGRLHIYNRQQSKILADAAVKAAKASVMAEQRMARKRSKK
jgi:hypothetical protein